MQSYWRSAVSRGNPVDLLISGDSLLKPIGWLRLTEAGGAERAKVCVKRRSCAARAPPTLWLHPPVSLVPALRTWRGWGRLDSVIYPLVLIRRLETWAVSQHSNHPLRLKRVTRKWLTGLQVCAVACYWSIISDMCLWSYTHHTHICEKSWRTSVWCWFPLWDTFKYTVILSGDNTCKVLCFSCGVWFPLNRKQKSILHFRFDCSSYLILTVLI